jgi:hypothetical protein
MGVQVVAAAETLQEAKLAEQETLHQLLRHKAQMVAPELQHIGEVAEVAPVLAVVQEPTVLLSVVLELHQVSVEH